MLDPRSPMVARPLEDLFVNRRAADTASVTTFCRADLVNFKMKFPFRYRVNVTRHLPCTRMPHYAFRTQEVLQIAADLSR